MSKYITEPAFRKFIGRVLKWTQPFVPFGGHPVVTLSGWATSSSPIQEMCPNQQPTSFTYQGCTIFNTFTLSPHILADAPNRVCPTCLPLTQIGARPDQEQFMEFLPYFMDDNPNENCGKGWVGYLMLSTRQVSADADDRADDTNCFNPDDKICFRADDKNMFQSRRQKCLSEQTIKLCFRIKIVSEHATNIVSVRADDNDWLMFLF